MSNEAEVFLNQLASLAHDAWLRRVELLLSQSVRHEDGSVTLPADVVAHVQRQMDTLYAALPASERERFRSEARKMCAVVLREALTRERLPTSRVCLSGVKAWLRRRVCA